jgi:hypothetical protein
MNDRRSTRAANAGRTPSPEQQTDDPVNLDAICR